MKNREETIKSKRNIIVILCAGICILILAIALIMNTFMKKKNIEMVSTQIEESKAITVNASIPNESNFTYVTSEEGIQVPVPKGYVASPDAEERYVNGVTTDGVREHHGGFVIYERLASDEGKTDEQVQQVIDNDLDEAQRTRNQWVWVPIADAGDMYHTSNNQIYGNTYTFSASSYSKSTGNNREPALVTNYDYDHTYLKQYLEEISRNEFLQEMREEFYEMIESVKTYKGFYIGRYETGNINQKIPVIVKGNSNISNVQWYLMYKRNKNLKGNNKTVQTGLMWGIQWDETMKWLISSREKTAKEISGSTSWGNYYDATFTYTNPQGKISTKSANSRVLIPTGSAEYSRANNIYDLAGNIWEYTMEIYNDNYRYCRGGYYFYKGSAYHAGSRDWDGYPDNSLVYRRLPCFPLYSVMFGRRSKII